MALLFTESFEHEGDGPNLALKWGRSGGTAYFVPTNSPTPRTGTMCGVVAIDDCNTKPLPVTPGASAIVHFAFRLNTYAVDDIVRIWEGATGAGGIVHAALALSASGQLQFKRGTTVLQTATAPIPLNSWMFIEWKCKIDDTVGSYEVKLDGSVVLGGTGVDTRNGGTGQWDRVGWNNAIFQTTRWIDDVCICDSSGPRNNDYLGPIKVERLLPQIGNGSNVGLTPSTGTDHGALVDEVPPNSSDYNSSATVGAKDTYNLPSLALTGAILGIQTSLYVSKTDAGPRSCAAVVRAGGVDYDGANFSPLTTYTYFSEIREVNPNTGVPWTSPDIDALEVGMKITA